MIHTVSITVELDCADPQEAAIMLRELVAESCVPLYYDVYFYDDANKLQRTRVLLGPRESERAPT